MSSSSRARRRRSRDPFPEKRKKNDEKSTAVADEGDDGPCDGDGVDSYPPSESIMVFARNGDIEGVQSAIKRDINRLRSHDDRGWTALHEAAHNGRYECSKFLIDAGADVNSTTEDHETPLHIVCLSRLIMDDMAIKIAELLIDSGANRSINVGAVVPSCLNCALSNERFQLAIWLLDRVDSSLLGEVSFDGRTCAHEAARKGAIEFLKRITSLCPALFCRLDVYGQSPLCVAVDEVQVDSVKLIIDNFMKQVEGLHGQVNQKRYSDGITPTTLAVVRGSYEILEMLLDIGGKGDVWVTRNGLPPALVFGDALSKDRDDLIYLLLKHDCMGNKRTEESPWIMAIDMNAVKCLKMFCRFPSILPWPSNDLVYTAWDFHPSAYIEPYAIIGDWIYHNEESRSLTQLALMLGCNFETLKFIVEHDKPEYVQVAVKEAVFYRSWTRKEVRYLFYSRLKEFPFTCSFRDLRFQIDMLGNIIHKGPQILMEMLALGLEIDVRNGNWCLCNSSSNHHIQEPDLGEILLTYSCRPPSCCDQLLKKLSQKYGMQLQRVGTLASFARRAVIRLIPLSIRSRGDDWVKSLGLPLNVDKFLLFERRHDISHLRK